MFTTRKKTMLAAGLAVAAGVLLVPAAASAHVSVSPDAAAAGSTVDLTFGIGHGCDGSATTAVRIEMPEDGIAGPKPIVQGGWTVAVEKDGEAGAVSAVTFTADEPVSDDTRAEVRLNVGILSDAAGELVFPVEQTCEDGSVSWSEVAESGEDPHDLDSPAPLLTVGAASDDAEGHGASAAHAEAEPAASSGALPIALGGAGLVAGLAALGVSIAALRRRG